MSEVIDRVKITSDGDFDHFEIIDEPIQHKAPDVDQRSWWQKLKDWWNDAPVTPYVKTRDLADPLGDRADDPFDMMDGNPTGVEVGIKVKF